MGFISYLAKKLIEEKEVYDLSRVSEFYFFGLHETVGTIDFVGLVQADELNELQIVELRDKFLKTVQTATYEFGIRTYGRNPNGLLIFVFEQNTSGKTHTFIKKQSKATIFKRPAVIFSWTVDTQDKQIYTHDRWVHSVPPIFILESAVFPGKNFIDNYLESYTSKTEVYEADQNSKTLKNDADKLPSFSPAALDQLEALFDKFVDQVIEKMPEPKYNLPNVRELRVYEKIEHYNETRIASETDIAESLEDLKSIIDKLQIQNPKADEQQAITVLDVEFQEIQRREPQRWKNLLSLRRWWNGAKTGALRAGEHFSESTPWGKAGLGFLEGFSEDID